MYVFRLPCHLTDIDDSHGKDFSSFQMSQLKYIFMWEQQVSPCECTVLLVGEG